MLASAAGPSALLQAFNVHADFRRAFQVKAQFQHRHTELKTWPLNCPLMISDTGGKRVAFLS